MKIYHRLSDHRKAIDETFKGNYKRGYKLSFSSFRNSFSVVLGYPMVIYGPPYSGKTQWAFEMMIQLSEMYGACHVIASPETGSPAEVFQELVEMVAEKDLAADRDNQMSLEQRQEAELFIEEHFIIVDVEITDDQNMRFREFYESIDKISIETGKTIWCTLLDTFDEVEIEWSKGQRDLVLQKELFYLRKNAKRTGRCHMVVAHLSGQEMKTHPKYNIDYWPMPYPQQLIHGQEWYRRSFTMIGVWRPPWFLKDADGNNYEENSTVILFGKRKPKWVFKKGNKDKSKHVYFDTMKQRYYIMTELGTRQYGSESTEKIRGGEVGFDLTEH